MPLALVIGHQGTTPVNEAAVRAQATREVVSRCEFFRQKLWENPVGVAWQAQFSGCIALLRSVGHVLDKVDAASSERLASNARKWWDSIKASKPEARIFWEFIEKERNLILKESEIRAGQSVTIDLRGVQAQGSVAGEKPEPTTLLAEARTEPSYSYQMNQGHFAGRDPRELIGEAIAWWHQQILIIETS
jgi:hypothetical protein